MTASVIAVMLVQTAAFLLFAGLCIAIAIARAEETRRKRIVMLAAYVVAIHLIIGISQKDAWPFANYRLMHGLAPADAELWRYGFYGVDAQGREWRIDPYAWRSMSDWHLQNWFLGGYSRLPAEQKPEAMAWLYKLAEAQRVRLAQGGTNISPLGPLSARQLWLFPRELSVPHEPYRAIRVYRALFHPGEAAAFAQSGVSRETAPIARTLIGEWKAQ
jgi:hypothetical protein